MKSHANNTIYRALEIEVEALEIAAVRPEFSSYRGTRILWAKSGVAGYRIDMHSDELTAGDVLCVKSGQVFRIINPGSIHGHCIYIPDGLLEVEDLLKLLASADGISVDVKDAGELEDTIAKITKEISTDDAVNRDIVRRYTEIFVILLTRFIKGRFTVANKTRNVELTDGFISLLERHYREKKMVTDYASLLAVTPNYLNEIVKKITGQSAGYHIRQRVALEAKRHAVHSSLCMKEVAYTLGFADIAHFSKFFKNATGRNFTDFRRERVVFSIIPAPAAA